MKKQNLLILGLVFIVLAMVLLAVMSVTSKEALSANCSHNGETWWDRGNFNQHLKRCNSCEEVIEWHYGKDTDGDGYCDVEGCGFSNPATAKRCPPHNNLDAWRDNGGYHTQKCLDCGQEVYAHLAEDKNNDNSCDYCGLLINSNVVVCNTCHGTGKCPGNIVVTQVNGVPGDLAICPKCGEKQYYDRVYQCTICGIKGYNYGCYACGRFYSTENHKDAACPDCQGVGQTTEPIIVVVSCEHQIIPVLGFAPNCTANGNIPYYKCQKCGEIFKDSEGKQSISLEETIIPATGHKNIKTVYGAQEHWDECLDCGMKMNIQPNQTTQVQKLEDGTEIIQQVTRQEDGTEVVQQVARQEDGTEIVQQENRAEETQTVVRQEDGTELVQQETIQGNRTEDTQTIARKEDGTEVVQQDIRQEDGTERTQTEIRQENRTERTQTEIRQENRTENTQIEARQEDGTETVQQENRTEETQIETIQEYNTNGMISATAQQESNLKITKPTSDKDDTNTTNNQTNTNSTSNQTNANTTKNQTNTNAANNQIIANANNNQDTSKTSNNIPYTGLSHTVEILIIVLGILTIAFAIKLRTEK